MSNIQANPIIVRELRARWRGIRPFVLVFAYATLLASIICFTYSSVVLDAVRSTREIRHSSIIGHELFMHLSWVQILAWMLLGPALTAPVIAGEREHGLLEGLQLSPLSPERIVLGKLAAAMVFMAVMMLVPVPIIAICFLLGGVSPMELWLGILLQVATGVAGASLGLACSARSHRAGTAFSSTFGLIILWGVGSGAAFLIATIPFALGGLRLWPWVRDLCSLFALTNPITASLSITNHDYFGQMLPASSLSLWFVVPPGTVCIGFCALASWFLLWLAALAVRKPLPELNWVELKPRRRAAMHAEVGQSLTSPEAAMLPRQAPQHSTPQRVTSRWELPLLSGIHFSNPVLQREVRGRTRFRQMTKLHAWSTSALFLALAYGYYRLLRIAIADVQIRGTLWIMLAVIVTVGIMLSSVLMAANTLSREREAGTWEAVNLSLLSPWQIISGKLSVILMICGLGLVPMLPLLLTCVDYSAVNRYQEISPLTAAVAFLLLGVTAWCYTAYGLLLSWLCRRSITAMSWTIGSLIILLCFLPIVISVLNLSRDETDFFVYWHPAFTMGYLAEVGLRDRTFMTVFMAICFLFLAGSACLLLLGWLMRRGIRERDGSFKEPAATVGKGDPATVALVSGQS